MSACAKSLSGVHIPSRYFPKNCGTCGEPLTSLARSADPETSKAAGSLMQGSLRQSSLKAQIMRALGERDGQTSGEIADALGLSHDKVWRRVSDLKNDGKIAPDGSRVWHGRAQQVWWIV